MHKGTFLSGKVAIVTGGGRGIGRAISLRLSELGAHVFVAGKTQATIDETAGLVTGGGGKATAVRIDVSREDDVAFLFDAVAKAGPVDILVNNAGVGVFAKLVDTTLEEWEKVMAVNVRGAFLCSRAAMRAMAGRGGRIINIASVVGFKGYANQSAYAASKHGLVGLSKVMAAEGQTDGIITQVIAPGGVDTDLAASARPDLDRSGMIVPDDMADAVEYLLGQTGNAVVDLIQIRRRGNAAW